MRAGRTRARLLTILVTSIAVAAVVSVQGAPVLAGPRVPLRPVSPRRIVSLAPSVTEVLFASGCGSRVVGVTSYCRYPAEAAQITKVGGYITPSYEAITALRPDFVVLLPEHEDARRHLTALGLSILELDHRTIRGILDSVRTLGQRCDTREQAEVLVSELQGRLERIEHAIAGRPRPRVVISLARGNERGFGSLSAAGPGGIYDDLLSRAGGRNAVPPGPILHPALSAESLLRLKPDAIVEFAPAASDREGIRAEWRALSSLEAVRHNRVFVFTEDFLPVPGPRLVRLVGDLARALHPGARWGIK